jgi:tRNA A-37 threonylcarbamoyl transferase component Bud32
MNTSMLAMLGIWEIAAIVFALLFLAAGVIGLVLLAVWLGRRGTARTPGEFRSSNPPEPVPTPAASDPGHCPQCGANLPSNAPQGLCPRCVLGVGLAAQTEVTDDRGPHGTRIVTPPEEEVARRFPHLEILGCLGQGGMGVVYKARQPKLNRLVALKILAPEKGAEPKFAERFQREAQALARLNHPNIVTVYDFGDADGMFFLLMEYVDGMTLRQLLRDERLKPEEAVAIVPPICAALEFAHSQGIVHRDIKPENVLLDQQGRVKIADFGIAKLVGPGAATPALTEEKCVIGTPNYMAPEQIERPERVDHRADIYSLGVVFYEMLTGELPLGKFQPPSRRVRMDVRLDEVVLHALEKEPERRYQRAGEVRTDVEMIAVSSGSSGGDEVGNRRHRSVPRADHLRRSVRTPAYGLMVAGGVQVLVCLALVFFAIPAVAREGGDLGGYTVVGFMATLSAAAAVVVLSGAISMLRMKRHLLTMIASAVAMVSGPAALVGFPFGLWALLVLVRREVREAFEGN